MSNCNNCIHWKVCPYPRLDENEDCVNFEQERPYGEWLYPYADVVISGKRIGKRTKKCSNCESTFDNQLPWDARFCPYCGSDNRIKDGEKSE